MANTDWLAVVTVTLLGSLVSSGATAASDRLGAGSPPSREPGYDGNVGVGADRLRRARARPFWPSYEPNAGLRPASPGLADEGSPEAESGPGFRNPKPAVESRLAACRTQGCPTAEKQISASSSGHPRQIATAIVLERPGVLTGARYPSLRWPEPEARPGDRPPSRRRAGSLSLAPPDATATPFSSPGRGAGAAAANGIWRSFTAGRLRLNAFNRIRFGLRSFELGYGDRDAPGLGDAGRVTYGLTEDRAVVFGARGVGLGFSSGEGRTVLKFGYRKRRATVELELRF